MAHKWATLLHHPYRLGGPQRFSGQKWRPRNREWNSKWGDNIRNSPQKGPMAVRSEKTYFLGKSFTS